MVNSGILALVKHGGSHFFFLQFADDESLILQLLLLAPLHVDLLELSATRGNFLFCKVFFEEQRLSMGLLSVLGLLCPLSLQSIILPFLLMLGFLEASHNYRPLGPFILSIILGERSNLEFLSLSALLNLGTFQSVLFKLGCPVVMLFLLTDEDLLVHPGRQAVRFLLHLPHLCVLQNFSSFHLRFESLHLIQDHFIVIHVPILTISNRVIPHPTAFLTWTVSISTLHLRHRVFVLHGGSCTCLEIISSGI